MMTIGINKIEANKYIEYIQNYISDSLSEFQENYVKEIENTVYRIKLNSLTDKALKQIVDIEIVSPYISFAEKLTKDLDEKICEYFDFEENEFTTQPMDCSIYSYKLNSKLFKEYERTENLSGVMEKLINKTIDFAFLDKVKTPYLRKFIDPLSVGSLFMSSLGLDGNNRRIKHKEELCKILKGISKNIILRTRKSLLIDYSKLIYQIMDEIDISYEQAI